MNVETSDFDFAYLAGFVDGDGYIYIGTDTEGYRVVSVGLTQKDVTYLELWKNKMGCGHIGANENQYGKTSCLAFSGKATKYLCRGMAPFLRLKRDKALAVIKEELPRDTRQEMFWPYLAGLIDAEGTVGIYNVVAGKKKAKYATPRLQIPQVDKALLESIQADLGYGRIISRGKSQSGKQVWYLGFGSKEVIRLVEKVRPYLIIKASNADFVLSHQKKVRIDSATDRPEAQQAAELYQAGVPIAQIANQLGAKPATVNYWLRRKGLTRSYKEAQQLRRKQEKDA